MRVWGQHVSEDRAYASLDLRTDALPYALIMPPYALIIVCIIIVVCIIIIIVCIIIR